jgi:LmbE family N-acetylglucosaminyl deacetylase
LDIEQSSTGFEAFDEVKRAIVVCAHADDLETMCGGTIAMLVARGVEVYELICTLGDLGSHDLTLTRETLAEMRARESQEAGRVLGLREVVTLGHHDGELEPSLKLREQVAAHYRRWQPDTLFTFDPWWPGQVHPDHRAAGMAALDAYMPSKMEFYHPEQLEECQVANLQRVFFFTPRQPTVFVDVSGVYDRKIAASLAHKSQFPEGEKNLEWMRELDAQAAKVAGLDATYAEQFGTMRVW